MGLGLKPDAYAQETAERAVRLALQAIQAIGSFDGGPTQIADAASDRAITNDDDRAYLIVNDADRNLTWPDSLTPGHTCTILLLGDSSLTIAGSGDATFEPTGIVATNTEGDLTAVVVIHRTGGAHLVVAPKPADTVTVIYNEGWPTERPASTHVLAVGHTSAPSWLTAADVWLEAV